MSHFYLDSSAIAKRYLTETGSTWVKNIADDQQREERASNVGSTHSSHLRFDVLSCMLSPFVKFVKW